MSQIVTGDAHGLFRVFVGLVSSNGFNIGTNQGPDLPAQGTAITPYELRYPQEASVTMPDRTVVDFTGGDVWTGSYVYGITSLGSFSLTSSTVEATLIALLSSSSVDNTQNTLVSVFSENILLPTPPQAWVMTVFRIQSKEAGSVGADKFMTIILPRCWVTPQGISGAPSFQSAGSYSFTMVPTTGDRMPWGPLFNSITVGGELVTNGTFDADTDWNKGTGWTIGAGTATCDGSQIASTDLDQTAVFGNTGDEARVTFTVSGYSAGTMDVLLGSGTTALTGINANGTYTARGTVSGNTDLIFRGDTDWAASLDNVTAGTETTINLNFEDNIVPNFYMITDAPTHAVAEIATAAQTSTTITLPFRPRSFDYSTPDSSTQPVQVYVDGVQVDAASINDTTGDVVVNAFPGPTWTGGEYIGVFYETNYVPTS